MAGSTKTLDFDLNDLLDVNVGTPGSGDTSKALVWDNTTGTFIFTTSALGAAAYISVPVSIANGGTGSTSAQAMRGPHWGWQSGPTCRHTTRNSRHWPD